VLDLAPQLRSTLAQANFHRGGLARFGAGHRFNPRGHFVMS
jgi:hypothetical protein